MANADTIIKTRRGRLHLRRERPAAPGGGKDDMLKLLQNRLYENEQGIYITNGLSTELIAFPSDRYPSHEGVLSEKVRSAISYATSLNDMPELNAMRYMPMPGYGKVPDPALTLGLYLYLADEASRLDRPTTMLGALREAHVELGSGDGYTPIDMLEKGRRAMDILMFKGPARQCIEDWWTKGTYTTGGEVNKAAVGELQGAYAKLAKKIAGLRAGQAEGLDLAISYALGNRAKIAGKSEPDMLSATRGMSEKDIRERISIGVGQRARHIRKVIEEQVPVPESPHTPPSDVIKIFSGLPREALEVFYREGYTCAYVNEANLRNCYPKEDVPGPTHDQNEFNRDFCTGLSENRFRMLFLCNGMRQETELFKSDPEVRFEMTRQTAAHEIMHLMTNYLDKNEMNELRGAVTAVADEISARGGAPAELKKQLRTIYTRRFGKPGEERSFATLEEAMTNTGRYSGYSLQNASEEIACNAYGLMHTEYAKTGSKHGGGNPFYEEVDGFSSLKKLGGALENAAATALKRCREQHPLAEPEQGCAK